MLAIQIATGVLWVLNYEERLNFKSSYKKGYSNQLRSLNLPRHTRYLLQFRQNVRVLYLHKKLRQRRISKDCQLLRITSNLSWRYRRKRRLSLVSRIVSSRFCKTLWIRYLGILYLLAVARLTRSCLSEQLVVMLFNSDQCWAKQMTSPSKCTLTIQSTHYSSTGREAIKVPIRAL